MLQLRTEPETNLIRVPVPNVLMSSATMLEEINRQPETLLATVAHQKENEFRKLALDILRAKQVVFTACGSSRYAALIGRFMLSKLGHKFADVVMASEFGYFSSSLNKESLVIAVSQSGETADVVAGVRLAKEAGAHIVSVVNRTPSILETLSDRVIELDCGPEVAVAATKSFTSQVAAFCLLAHATVDRYEQCEHNLEYVAQQVARVIKRNGIKALASRLKDQRDWYYIARGINFAVASEGALKLKEVSYLHAEGLPAGELKHGTLALIDEGVPVVSICPNDSVFRETMSNTIEAKCRGAHIIGVSDVKSEVWDDWLWVPKVDEIFYPLVTVVPLQLLAYHVAVAKGLTPERPRNLAKSCTVL